MPMKIKFEVGNAEEWYAIVRKPGGHYDIEKVIAFVVVETNGEDKIMGVRANTNISFFEELPKSESIPPEERNQYECFETYIHKKELGILDKKIQ